jgi:hypothetical protein
VKLRGFWTILYQHESLEKYLVMEKICKAADDVHDCGRDLCGASGRLSGEIQGNRILYR